jgi:hypothetical protein
VELAGHECGRDVLAPEMTPDPKIIVARGYDAIAEIYHRRFESRRFGNSGSTS